MSEAMREVIYKVLANEPIEAKNLINSALLSHAREAISVRKVDVASSLMLDTEEDKE